MKVRVLITGCAVAMSSFGVMPQADAGVTAEGRALQLINKARRSRGIPVVRRSPALDLLAERHARAMRRSGKLFHSRRLSVILPGSWSSWGENVAYGPTTRTMHRAFMRSPGHRRNILAKRWDQVGIGVVRGRDGQRWETQIFVDR